MPPKRRTADPSATAPAAADDGKKPKIDDKDATPTTAPTPAPAPASASTSTPATADTKTDGSGKKPAPTKKDDDIIDSDDDEPTDSRSKCLYGINCYRKNPDHMKNFWHPKAKKSTSSSSSSSSTSSSSTTPTLKRADSKLLPPGKVESDVDDKLTKAIDNYKNILKIILGKNKISADDKRTLREFRKSHDISDHHHFRALSQFGWTEDEYDDGERKDDNTDLGEERSVLMTPGGFKVIWLNRADVKKMNKEEENVFSRVCTRFFQTMARAQSNYLVKRVGIIANTALREQFNKMAGDLKAKGLGDLEWGFHGSTEDSIDKISRTGFLHPDEIKKLKKDDAGAAKGKAKGKGKGKGKSKIEIEVLDEGFFGRGIYFSFYSDYAMYYSEERSSCQILLSQLLVGNAFKCTKRMDGMDLMKGYHSHYSPKGNEVVIFSKDQILPRYIIEFERNEEEEREQEF